MHIYNQAMRLASFFSSTILFLLLVASGVCWAQEYKIEIRQINPDKWTYSASCEEGQLCHVFMGIAPKSGTFDTNDLELDVGVFLKESEAHFQFKSGDEYFYSEDEKNVLSLPKSGKEKMTIYKRSPVAEGDPEGPYNLLVIRPAKKPLAELEINIIPE